jgi:(2R)-3-sulfolactate dehydrogenase (NADP+)
MERHPHGALLALALDACRACGAHEDMAQSLARASLSASRVGRHEVGLAHLLDHLDSLRAGRIRGAARPVIDSPAPALIRVDAQDGIAQLGFDLAFEDFTRRARHFGIALLVQRGCYPAGELGYFARRLAEAGLIGLGAGNAHALMAVRAGFGKAFSTNPMAFAAPLPPPRPPLLIDQASSATAFVNLARAAAEGQPITEGWALDAAGQPTTDAQAALAGAMLPFGGYKGANVALMVEVLAAGLTGANWSLDTGHFLQGAEPPAAGMAAVAISPALCDPEFSGRLATQLDRLAAQGVHLPGSNAPAGPARDDEPVSVAPAVLTALRRHAGCV